MPRPRKDPNAVLTRELRITPPDGEPITDWCLDDTITKLVAFVEGGEDKKLHYHALIETTMTSQALTKWIYRVARCIETGEKGNAVFFTRAPHEGTQGYISKGRDMSIRHGTQQTTIEEWFTQSDEYVRQRETKRKRVQRSREDELKLIIDIVEKGLHDNRDIRNVEDVSKEFLKHCHHSGIRFPTRSQMETVVVKLLYPYDERIVIKYYTRSFPDIFCNQ